MQAEAWLAFEKGDQERAETLMQSAAVLEEQTDKSSISPGRVLPAYEQLGDLLMEMNRPEEALTAYEQSMKFAPERLNTYLGASRAANAAGHSDLSRYYDQKVEETLH